MTSAHYAGLAQLRLCRASGWNFAFKACIRITEWLCRQLAAWQAAARTCNERMEEAVEDAAYCMRQAEQLKAIEERK